MKTERLLQHTSLLGLLIVILGISVMPVFAGNLLSINPVATVCRDFVTIDYDNSQGSEVSNMEVTASVGGQQVGTTTVTIFSIANGRITFALDMLVDEGSTVDINITDNFTYYVNKFSGTASGICLNSNTGSSSSGGSSVITPLPPMPCATDGRINEWDCSAPVALYVSFNDDGWMLQIWSIDDEGNGAFEFLIYEEDVPEAGETNITLDSVPGIILYLLSTGEFQVNAVYHTGEKVYVLIFDIPPTIVYRADFSLSDF